MVYSKWTHSDRTLYELPHFNFSFNVRSLTASQLHTYSASLNQITQLNLKSKSKPKPFAVNISSLIRKSKCCFPFAPSPVIMKRKYAEQSVLKSTYRRQQLPFFSSVKKQPRSRLPQKRRRRFQLSPVLNTFFTGNNYSSRLITVELSFECDSSKLSGTADKRSSEGGNKMFGGVSKDNYCDEGTKNVEVEVSEYSCVESCSGAVSVDKESKLRRGVGRVNEFAHEERFTRKTMDGKLNKSENLLKFDQNDVSCEGTEVSESVDQSEVSVEVCGENSKIEANEVSRLHELLQFKSNDVISRNSVLSNFQKASAVEKVHKHESREDQGKQSDAELAKKLVPADVDFTCSENFPNDIVSDDYSSAYSDLQSEIFPDSSDFDMDYTPSVWYDSGSQFSENSNESPSPTYQLFLQFSQEFIKLHTNLESDASCCSCCEDDGSNEITLLGLKNKEDQESYKMIRNRERRQAYLHDYAEDYCSTTEYGDLIIQQRLQMVHWIFEQCTNKELHKETMFLGVNLLDRLLSKGYFKTKRNLQIVGIACLSLATRIEENQPYNSVQQKIFHVGSNQYNRSEVVAMEWLVQEVLKFQCFLPTIYNFLWFYLKAARASEKVEKIVKYLSVLALLGHEPLNYWPSSVAAGLVILASTATNQEKSCNNLIEAHARMKDDDLPDCIESLSWLNRYIC